MPLIYTDCRHPKVVIFFFNISRASNSKIPVITKAIITNTSSDERSEERTYMLRGNISFDSGLSLKAGTTKLYCLDFKIFLKLDPPIFEIIKHKQIKNVFVNLMSRRGIKFKCRLEVKTIWFSRFPYKDIFVYYFKANQTVKPRRKQTTQLTKKFATPYAPAVPLFYLCKSKTYVKIIFIKIL